MLSLKEYTEIAVKMLWKHNIKKYSNEDVGIIVTALATADHKFNPKIGTLEQFRGYYGRFAILDLKKAKRKNKTVSIFDNEGEIKRSISDITAVVKHDTDPHDIINKVKNDKSISERDKDIFYRVYALEETLVTIAKIYNLSNERVRQIAKETLEKVRCKYKQI